MKTNPDDAARVARAILDIEAVHFYKDQPYRFTSGILSPMYIDCRKLISFPKERNTAMEIAAKTIRDYGDQAFDCIAGGETAGIPYAGFLAERLGLPMIYIRKKPKGFGTKQQIEGVMKPGARVLLVEDLMSDAGSKMNFQSAIENAGGKVPLLMVVYAYGFAKGEERLAKANLACHALTTCSQLMEQARQTGYFTNGQVETVLEFLKDPEGWGAKNGLE